MRFRGGWRKLGAFGWSRSRCWWGSEIFSLSRDLLPQRTPRVTEEKQVWFFTHQPGGRLLEKFARTFRGLVCRFGCFGLRGGRRRGPFCHRAFCIWQRV